MITHHTWCIHISNLTQFAIYESRMNTPPLLLVLSLSDRQFSPTLRWILSACLLTPCWLNNVVLLLERLLIFDWPLCVLAFMKYISVYDFAFWHSSYITYYSSLNTLLVMLLYIHSFEPCISLLLYMPLQYTVLRHLAVALVKLYIFLFSSCFIIHAIWVRTRNFWGGQANSFTNS